MLTRALIKNGGTLGIFALLATGLLAAVNYLTKPIIIEQSQQKLRNTLSALFIEDSYDNNIVNDCAVITEPAVFGTAEPIKVYRVSKAAQPVGLIYETVAPDGYSGDIQMLVGVDSNNVLSNVRVTNHKETPGLGDKIELRVDNWILSLSGKTLTPEQPFAVKKDGGEFDQFTGATITPRATLNAVAKVLQYNQTQQSQVWARENRCYE